jgi:arylsulfatase A-like enzyme
MSAKNRFREWAAVCVAVLTMIGSACFAASSGNPNIVVIYADDMGYGDCTANNPESKIPTPHIDRLAAEGMRFTDAHSPGTVCTPSRYGLLTGINPAREGIVNPLLKFGKPLIKESTPTIASFLREHGYATKMVGKWHLGFYMNMSSGRPEFDFSKPLTGGPADCGFDYYFGINKAPASPPYFYIRNREAVAKPTEQIEGRANVEDRRMSWQPGACAPGFVHTEVLPNMLKETVTLIHDHADQNKDKSLFIYLALAAPHTPLVPSKEFAGKSELGAYGDFVMEIDDLVGKLNAALEEEGMDKNTILIFSSDNGAFLIKGDKEKHGHSVNGVLRDGKAHPYEGGHRVPFLVKWPDVVPAGTVTDATVNHTDMFATLIDILGVKDGDRYLSSAVDSHSFLPVLKDPDTKFVRPAMFNTNSTCRIGEWKIVVGRKVLQGDVLDKSQVELYNLDKDLSETTDVSKDNPERLEQLVKAYEQYRSKWIIRPEAVMHQEGKKQKPGNRTPSLKDDARKKEKHPGPASETPDVPKKAKQSNMQKDKAEAPDSEYRRRIAELRKQMASVLMDEQTQARAAAKKKALEEGKKGAALRAAADAAVNLTNEQKKQLQELRQALGDLTREYRAQQLEMLKGNTQ